MGSSSPPTQHRQPSQQKDGTRNTYTTLSASFAPPVAYSNLPSSLPFADTQVPGVTSHSITIHHRNLKYLEKHKEEEQERVKKYRDKSNKEKARSGISSFIL